MKKLKNKKYKYNKTRKKKLKINKNVLIQNILIISTCSQKLSELEFVEPIIKIIKNYENKEKANKEKIKINYNVINYKNITPNFYELIKKPDKINLDNTTSNNRIQNKIIITGTALKDNEYLKNIEKFNFLKNIDIPVLGICSGMQIISLIYGSKLNKNKIIDFTEIKTIKQNNLFSGSFKVYELHNFEISHPKDFFAIALSNDKIKKKNFEKQKLKKENKYNHRTIAIKHKQKEIYGLLFHPEVRNEYILNNFLSINFLNI